MVSMSCMWKLIFNKPRQRHLLLATTTPKARTPTLRSSLSKSGPTFSRWFSRTMLKPKVKNGDIWQEVNQILIRSEVLIKNWGMRIITIIIGRVEGCCLRRFSFRRFKAWSYWHRIMETSLKYKSLQEKMTSQL